MKRRILFTLLLVTLLGGLAWFLFHQSPEPVYKGKTLRHWLTVYSLDYLNERQDQVDEAVRHFGTNAIPTLLEMLQEKDSPLKLKWIALLQKQRLLQPPKPAYSRNYQAQQAFGALGPAASNAVPTLVHIYRMKISDSSQGETLEALGGIGPSALPTATPVLLDALMDTNIDMRGNAAYALGQIHSQPEVFVPALIKALKDSTVIRFIAVRALAAYGPAAKTAVPALVPLLNDPSSYVRRAATNALKSIDPVAATNAGIK